MTLNRLHPIIFLVAICTSLLSMTVSAQDSEPTDMAGRELYSSYQCWQCHGYEAQGGAAPRLAAKDYPFEAFARFVRHPNLMPAYTQELLSDAKLRRIYDFVRSIPEPESLDDIPLLRWETRVSECL